MTDNEILISFIEIHKRYFGEEPKIEVVGNKVKINTDKTPIYIQSLTQFINFAINRLNKNKNSKDPLDKRDLYYLDVGIKDKTLTHANVALSLGFPRGIFSTAYSRLRDIEKTIEKVKQIINKEKKKITWNGVTKTPYEWAKSIGITTMGFEHRLRTYGVCELVFMSVLEFSEKKNNYENKEINYFYPEFTAGNDEWRNLDPKNPPKERLKLEDISSRSAENLISAMIQDAKENLITGDKKYFEDSKQFLSNRSGYLEWLLGASQKINSKAAIKHLKKFSNSFKKPENDKEIR